MSKIINKKGVSNGIAIAKAYIFSKEEFIVEKVNYINSDSINNTITEVDNAFFKAKEEVQNIYSGFDKSLSDKANIFLAHLEILNDISLMEEILNLINNSLYDSKSSVFFGFKIFIDMLSEVEDPYIKERVLDMIDIRSRLLRILSNKEEQTLTSFDSDVIIVTKDLGPSDTATMDKEHIKGILTEMGGETSHTAIIASSYGIPAILGISNLTSHVVEGELLIVDATKGIVILNPNKNEIEEYEEKRKEFLKEKILIDKYLSIEPFTKDNVHINVCQNIGSANAFDLEYEKYTSGVGLLRSEFLFMESSSSPTEEYQFDNYRKVLETYKDKPVIIRTLDIGGDKKLDYLKQDFEENPFLGNRALRLCLNNIELFKTQIRALLRASLYGNLWIMIPMVSSIDEIISFKKVFKECEEELKVKKQKFGDYKLGVMIEIPSLCLIAKEVAQIVDFASFGTNDLAQYLLAVDRMNDKVSSYYQNLHPSMFRIMKIAIDAFNEEGKSISVCGELGGNLIAAPILIGLGMRKLSMSRNKIARVKKLIVSNTLETFVNLSNEILKLSRESDIIDYVNKYLNYEEKK